MAAQGTVDGWGRRLDEMAAQANAGPEASAVYAAKVAMSGLLDRHGVA